jgi:chromosome segregation ATPase
VTELPEPDPREQQERYEKQLHELSTQVRFLEDEISLLRRRLTNAPRQVKLLEEKLLQALGPPVTEREAAARFRPKRKG